MSDFCLIRQDTDSRILGLECFNLVRLIPQNLAAEIAALPEHSLSEARLRTSQVEETKLLLLLGFSKVCCQVNYVMDLADPGQDPAEDPQTSLRLSQDLLTRHAANLRFSRFSLDPRLPRSTWLELHRRWVEHAMVSEKAYKFFIGENFVSFTLLADRVFVDLLSVLTPRQGLGAALLAKAADFGRARGLGLLEVCTESENEGACMFYQALGMRLEATYSILHLHRGRDAGK
jgi:GNAT superfamily N-acetyltransferase